jgi:hypothetical protein
LPFPQYRVWNTIAAFDTFLRAPDFAHDVSPAGFLGGGQGLHPPDGPAIAGDKQRLALLKLVQDRLGFLVQLFCGDYAHVLKVTPQKCPCKHKSFVILNFAVFVVSLHAAPLIPPAKKLAKISATSPESPPDQIVRKFQFGSFSKLNKAGPRSFGV